MLIHGSPFSVTLSSDPELKDRFWYWTGASGRKYIHSIYALEDCPPLPGAIYVAVRREGGLRVAVATGRFQPFWDGVLGGADLDHLRRIGAQELHVHLLTKSADQTRAVHADLAAAFHQEGAQHGEGIEEATQCGRPVIPQTEACFAAAV